ncbi:hypothetical protein APHAL10511_003863 [Amanita phalloides]|nr:hypothetical protein APHAL10511_003863 [Amanita phalloides]
MLVLSDEIAHVWRAKWSFPKFLYLFVRYFGIIYLVITTIISLRTHNSYKVAWQLCINLILTSPSDLSPKLLFDSIVGGINLFAALANIINTIRIHALYYQSRPVLITFLLLLIGQYAVGSWVSVDYVRSAAAAFASTTPSTDVFPGCPLSSHIPRGMLAAWILNLLNTSAAFFLTLWDFAWSIKRLSYPARTSRKNRFGTPGVGPLLWIFVQDGSVHYISVLAALLAFLVLTVIEGSPLSPMACSWLVAMYAFSATRLILNIRIYAARLQGGATTWQQAFSIRIEDTIQEGIDDGDAEAVVANSFRLRHYDDDWSVTKHESIVDKGPINTTQ